MAFEECGDASGDRLRALQMQQVSDALDGKILELGKPPVEQVSAFCEQPLGLRTEHREHGLRNGGGLPGAERPGYLPDPRAPVAWTL